MQLVQHYPTILAHPSDRSLFFSVFRVCSNRRVLGGKEGARARDADSCKLMWIGFLFAEACRGHALNAILG